MRATEQTRRRLGLLARTREPAAMRAVAGDADAARRTLIWLAAHGDDEVHRALCRNPATPPRLLYLLARTRIDALLANPRIFTLLTPDAPRPRIPRALLVQLLALEQVPVALIEGAAGHALTAMRQAAATSPHLSPETCQKLAGDRDPRVREQVAQRPGLPPALACALAADPEFRVRHALAYNPGAPAEALAVLAGDADWYTRRQVARHPELAWPVRAALLRDPRDEVREAAASKLVDADEPELRRLAGDPSDRVRTRVADCARTPPTVLTRLRNDPSLNVRAALTGNPTSPPMLIEALAADRDEAVRRALIKRPGLDPRFLIKFAEDDKELVRTDVAFAPATPLWLVEQLSHDPATRVRIYAIFSGRLSVATLHRMATDPSPHVRRLIAQADLGEGGVPLLKNLACDPERDVADAAARTLARVIASTSGAG